MNKIIVAPSMLSSDFANLEGEIKKLENYGVKWLHLDIMDGHFVNNISMGPPIIKSISKCTNLYLDCHLMVSNPEKWVIPCAKSGANNFTFHIETVTNYNELFRLIDLIKSNGMNVGIALKPGTSLKKLTKYPNILNLIDMVLIMTVEPGFGGQKFIFKMLDKIEELRKINSTINIQVDGGINIANVKIVKDVGANIIVSGSHIFKSNDPRKTIEKLASA